MDFNIDTWLNLLIRWFHVMAGIMWIGTSFFFVALDNSLEKQADGDDGHVGNAWLFHGGGYYNVEKSIVAKESILSKLQWYKWEAYLTWISGFFLMCVVYYWHANLYMIDPSVLDISTGAAIAISIGMLVVGWVVYDILWRKMGATQPTAAMIISLVLYVVAVYIYTHVFSGRAAYINSGALLGTIMAANVAMIIMPNQRRMYKAHRQGVTLDPKYSHQAKRRSTHNNYLTLPVIFMMISNHFAMTYGNTFNWLVLLGLFALGVGIDHFMNSREKGEKMPGYIALGCSFVILMVLVGYLATPVPTAVAEKNDNGTAAANVAPVSFSTVENIIGQRCQSCHSATPTSAAFSSAPKGITFDTPEQIKQQAAHIKAVAVDSQVMPLANLTQMTAEERKTLGAWIAQGANIPDGDVGK